MLEITLKVELFEMTASIFVFLGEIFKGTCDTKLPGNVIERMRIRVFFQSCTVSFIMMGSISKKNLVSEVALLQNLSGGPLPNGRSCTPHSSQPNWILNRQRVQTFHPSETNSIYFAPDVFATPLVLTAIIQSATGFIF